MKLNKLSQTISIVLATGLLASCGGGGSSSGSSSNTTTTSIGKIDGFGSIYVNGVEYDTSHANYHVDDESAFDDSALGDSDGIGAHGTRNLRRIGDFDTARGNDIAFDLPGDDNIACFDRASPQAVAGEGDVAIEVAIAFNLAVDHEVSGAGQDA